MESEGAGRNMGSEMAQRALGAGLPPALLDLLSKHYDEGIVDSILAGYAAPRATTLRANTLKASAGEVARALDAAGIAWSKPAFYDDAFIVDRACETALRNLGLYEQGGIYLQSLSAMLPPIALAPHADENILDMAAAPGGKTCQIAALANNRAFLTACEKNAVRAQKLRYNVAKQGVARCSVMECDARKLDPFFVFDKALLDAPCSGSGTVSLLDGTYQGGFSLELLERSVKTQRALLRRAIEAVRPGGIVVYATCSILPEENEQVIDYVLNPHLHAEENAGRNGSKRRGKGARRKKAAESPMTARAKVIPLPEKLHASVPLLPCSLEGAICVRPTEHYEGFFVAMLERTK